MDIRRLAPQSSSPFSKVVLLCAETAGYIETSEKIYLGTRVNPVIKFSFSNTTISETAKQKLETADLYVSYLIQESPIAQIILNAVGALQTHMTISSGNMRSGIQFLAAGTIANHMGRIFHRVNDIDSIIASEQFLTGTTSGKGGGPKVIYSPVPS